MTPKIWLIVKDDSKRTFEVCGQATSDNAFTNKTYAMQRTGMNISCVVLPVTNKTASKDLIKITAYTREDGLYERLLTEFRNITLRNADQSWDEE